MTSRFSTASPEDLWKKEHTALMNSLSEDEWTELATSILKSPARMLELQQELGALMVRCTLVGDQRGAEAIGHCLSAMFVISSAVGFIQKRKEN